MGENTDKCSESIEGIIYFLTDELLKGGRTENEIQGKKIRGTFRIFVQTNVTGINNITLFIASFQRGRTSIH